MQQAHTQQVIPTRLFAGNVLQVKTKPQLHSVFFSAKPTSF